MKFATFVDVLRWRALHQPDQHGFLFLVDGETEERSMTYQELDRQAKVLATRLQCLGATGKRALLIHPPGLDYITAFFGCLYAGVVAVPVYPPNPAQVHRTAHRSLPIACDAQPLVALTMSSLLSRVAALFAEDADASPVHWLATDTVVDDPAAAWEEPDIDGDTLAFLQYTSGSTTAPKGVMLTHSNLLSNAAALYRCAEYSSETRAVVWLPLYHDMGLIGGILQPLYGGFPVTLMSPAVVLQRPFRWLQAISRYKATTSSGPNFAYDLCVQRITQAQRANLDLSSWNVAFNGAEPIRHETLEQFSTTFAPCGFRRETFYPCYGLAEATLIVSGGLKAAQPVVQSVHAPTLAQNRVALGKVEDTDTRTLVGCGQTVSAQKIVIVDPHTCTRCLPQHVGEIWVSGPSVAQGYWNRPAETARFFRAYLKDTGEGPFLRTGDLGFLHEGELFVTGRLKDVIIIAGRNHYPQDIEWTVEQTHPALRKGCCAAFSIEVAGQERVVVMTEVERRYQSANRPRQGESRPRRAGSMPFDVAAVSRTIRQAVAQHHDLQVYAVSLLKAGSIAKTSSGKIQRHVCRARFLAGTLETLEA